MGNCLRSQSSMQWAGDDCGGAVAAPTGLRSDSSEEKEGLLLLLGIGKKTGFITSSSASSTEIKIKITKKQLEELLGKEDVKDLSVKQVLALLMMNVGTDSHHENHQRSWRPALQSIPEVN